MIGGSSGIGLETARRARAEGADVVLTGRDPERLRQAAADVGAAGTRRSTPPTPTRLDGFLAALPAPSTTSCSPPAARTTRRWPRWTSRRGPPHLAGHVGLILAGRPAGRRRVRPGGTLLFIGGTGAAQALGIASAPLNVGLPALTATSRSNSHPSASTCSPRVRGHPALGVPARCRLDARREQLRATLPIRRVVGPEDVAALAVHLMVNTALTGATYDVDGGEQII